MTLLYVLQAFVAYAVLDIVLGLIHGRCVLPGLKCQACKRREKEEAAK